MPRRRSAVDTDLDQLYAQVPALVCRGLCQSSCGPIEMSARERQRLRQHGVTVPPRQQALDLRAAGGADGAGYACPALSEDGACRVHELRPMVCRLWGAVRSLPCPHGCAPEGGLLPDADGMDLLAASLQAGGAPAGFQDVHAGVGEVLRKNPQLQRTGGSYVQHHRPRP